MNDLLQLLEYKLHDQVQDLELVASLVGLALSFFSVVFSFLDELAVVLSAAVSNKKREKDGGGVV